MADSSIEPCEISVPQDSINTLKSRLVGSKYPAQFETSSPWDIGAPVADIKRLAEYWARDFDWRKAEHELNELPNYRTLVNVDGFGDVSVHCKY